MSKVNCKKGFTLIEFLIYSGIVVFVMLFLTLAGIGVLFARVQVISMEEVNRNATFVLEKITYLIRSAESVDIASGSTLVLNMYSPVDHPTRIYLENEAIMIQRGEETPREITGDSVKVTSLSFQEFLPEAVRIEATFSFYNPSGRPEYDTVRTFKATENVRK